MNNNQNLITQVQECFFNVCDLYDWINEHIHPSGYLTQQELLDDLKDRLEKIELTLIRKKND